MEFESRRRIDELEETELIFGQVKRVTNFGVYIDCGLEGGILAFLHIRDVPDRVRNAPATATYSPGDRVRLYVKEVEWPVEDGSLEAADAAVGVEKVIGQIRDRPKVPRVKLTGMRPVDRAWVAW